MANKRRIVIKDGVVCGFADEVSFDGLVLQEYSKKRVSRIVPTNPFMRVAFEQLRARCPDESAIAEWTRGWRCQWKVLIDDETFGPFDSRLDAILFEKDKIYQQGKLTPSSNL